MTLTKEQLAEERRQRAKSKFIEKLQNRFNGEYELIGEYTTTRGRTTFFHHAEHCNSEFESTPEALIQNRNRKGCVNCMYLKRDITSEKTLEELIVDLERFGKGEFSYISGFINYSNPCLFKHNKCNSEIPYSVKPKDLLRRLRERKNVTCSSCKDNIKYSIEDVKKRIHEKTNGEFEIISNEYINNKSELKIKHLKNSCNHVQERLAHLLFNNEIKCEICDGVRSVGEIKIINYLKENNIKYKSEVFKYNKEKDQRMFFDFYIPEYDLFIEYDGRHHFTEDNDFFENPHILDQWKNEWVEKNTESGLVRVPYNYDLDEFLNDLFVNNEISESLFTVNI